MKPTPIFILWLRRVLFAAVIGVGLYFPISKIIAMEFPEIKPQGIHVPVSLRGAVQGFGGSCIQINFSPWQLVMPPDFAPERHTPFPAYAVAILHPDGSCTPTAVSLERPSVLKQGEILLKGTITQRQKDTVSFALPSRKFILNKTLVEQAGLLSSRRFSPPQNIKVLVSIYADGFALLNGITVDDIPLERYIHQGEASDSK